MLLPRESITGAVSVRGRVTAAQRGEEEGSAHVLILCSAAPRGAVVGLWLSCCGALQFSFFAEEEIIHFIYVNLHWWRYCLGKICSWLLWFRRGHGSTLLSKRDNKTFLLLATEVQNHRLTDLLQLEETSKTSTKSSCHPTPTMTTNHIPKKAYSGWFVTNFSVGGQ